MNQTEDLEESELQRELEEIEDEKFIFAEVRRSGSIVFEEEEVATP